MSRNDIKVVMSSMMPEHWEAAEVYFYDSIFPGNEGREGTCITGKAQQV